ncbi:MAG TPA: flagellar protein FlgN [Steroidobacteraceae bacterium]|nr:flagellar protein FlgN [Candidatus Dormibacteraeota bacterium]HYM26638.1 flagellar protein FlgN [Steroidobacteraceae bacterium]
MNPTLCREHLAELIREELKLLAELHTLLDGERAVISSGDLKGLQRSTAMRQQRMAALANTETQRRSLCSLHGHTPDAAGMERLLAWCDPRAELAGLLRECRERALKCRELNDRNGLMVAARLKRVDERLQALRGRADRSATYGPRGDMPRSPAGRVLGAV